MYGLLMDTTLNPKQTDPPNVLVARADEGLAHAHEQITRADEEIARAEEQLSKLEREAARHPSDHPQTRMNTFRPAVPGKRPSLGGRAVRGFIGLMFAACIGVAAFVWQSPYRAAPKAIGPSATPHTNFNAQAEPAAPVAASHNAAAGRKNAVVIGAAGADAPALARPRRYGERWR